MSLCDSQPVEDTSPGRDEPELPTARRPVFRPGWRWPVLAGCMRDRAVALAISGLVIVQLVSTAFGAGLWRCPLRQATGIPCPGCGMTQSALAIADFDWYNVWQLNPFAPVVMVGVVLTAVDLQTSLVSSPFMIYSPQLEGPARKGYTGSVLVHQVSLSCLMMLTLVTCGLVVSFGIGPGSLQPVMWALAVAAPVILLREQARRICFARREYAVALVLDFCSATVQVSVLLFLAASDKLSPALTFLVLGIGAVVGVVVWVPLTRSSIAFRSERVLTDLAKNWAIGKWIFASGVLYALSMYLYPWILAFFHGTAATGVWAACFGVVAIVNPLLFGVQNYVGPELAHSYAAGGVTALSKVLRTTGTILVVMILPFVGVLVFFGGELVTLLYGEQYRGNGAIVAVLGVNLLAVAASIVCSRALFAIQKADLDFATNIVAVLAVMTVGVWLVSTQGPLGVAWALLAGNLAITALKVVSIAVLIRRSD